LTKELGSGRDDPLLVLLRLRFADPHGRPSSRLTR
jgi:hypothetical protein